jgi:hypothetical protein
MLKRISIGLLLLIILTLIGVTVFLTSSGYYLGFLVGNSMEPTIPNLSLVVFQAPEDIEIGQIVAFNHHSYVTKVTEESIINSQTYKDAINNFTIHRVVAQSGEDFITKGDNNNKEDLLYVGREDIRGICVYHNPFLLYISLFFIGILLVALILLIIKSIADRRKRMGRA